MSKKFEPNTSTVSSSSSSSSNRKPSTITSSFLSPKSNFKSLSYSNSLRSNSIGQSSSSNVSPIKKTNSFSSLDSTTFTNSFSSKVTRASKLTKPYSNQFKHYKTNRTLIDSKFSLDNQSSCNKSTEITSDYNLTNQENELSKASKRFSKSKLRNNAITNKFNDLLEGNGVSSSSKNTPTEPLIMNCETISDTANHESVFSSPSCSHSDKTRQGYTEREVQKEENDNKQANHYLDSSRVSKGGDDSENANDDTNIDDLAHLEINKCNIADDSDDSESNKFIQSRFVVTKMNFDSSSTLSQYSKSVNNQPVNQNLTSPQSSNVINSSDLSNRELSKGQVNCTLSRSIRNSNTTTIRNPCQMHRASISSNDLMSSSNYHPSHRLLYSSYNSPSSNCCHNHFRHHHHHYDAPNHRIDSMIPISSFRQQQCLQANQKHPFEFGMSSIEATTIISNHCNTENTNAPNSAAITKLTSSSTSGFPVTALTVMESPNLSSSRNGSYNWQAFMSTLKDRMATIFNCELLADVHFNVGKGNTQTRFPAHKFILSIGSAVFDAMFNGPLAKANKQKYSDTDLHLNNSDTEIELPDIEPEAFQALLRFLYLDEVQIGPETVMTTLYAAKKYEVPALEMACVDFLKANLSPDNAFMLLTQARLFDEATLADLCLETIDKHTMDSLYSDSFFDIDLDTLKLVLSRDSLRVREVSLFLAALRWAECECNRRSFDLSSENKRNVLDDALYLIRFPLMTIEEFAHNVAQSAVLTDKELVNLFLHFTVSSKPSVPFSIEPRCCITGEECSVNRFQRTESRWGYSGTSDRIRFLTDRPIFVIGFGLFGSIHGASEYEAVIEVIHTGSGKVLASNATSFISDGSDSTFRVMFKYPVEISQNTNYTACATLKGVDSYYGTNGYRTVTVNLGKGDTKDAVTFQFSYAAGCNNGTSVEDGQIPEIIFYT